MSARTNETDVQMCTVKSKTSANEKARRLSDEEEVGAAEWEDVTDPILRRKLQNRINQRLSSKGPTRYEMDVHRCCG
jgi:hypothetical protein